MNLRKSLGNLKRFFFVFGWALLLFCLLFALVVPVRADFTVFTNSEWASDTRYDDGMGNFYPLFDISPYSVDALDFTGYTVFTNITSM